MNFFKGIESLHCPLCKSLMDLRLHVDNANYSILDLIPKSDQENIVYNIYEDVVANIDLINSTLTYVKSNYIDEDDRIKGVCGCKLNNEVSGPFCDGQHKKIDFDNIDKIKIKSS